MRRPRLTALLAATAAVLFIAGCSDSTAPLLTPDQEPSLEIAFGDPTCKYTVVNWSFTDIPQVPDVSLIWLPGGYGDVTHAYQVLQEPGLTTQDDDGQEVIGRAYVHYRQGNTWVVQLNMPIKGHMDVLHLVANITVGPRDNSILLNHDFTVSKPRTRGIFEAAAIDGQKVRVLGEISRPGTANGVATWTIRDASIHTCGIPTRGPNDWFKLLGEDGKCAGLECSFWATPIAGRDSRANKIGTWQWSIGGVTYNAQYPTHSFPYSTVATTYEVKLTVTDRNGLTNPVTQPQYVICEKGACRDAAIKRPLAEFIYECDGMTCQFTDRSDPYGDPIISWYWQFGDNSTSVLRNPQHTFGASGTYRVSLTVTDGAGIFNTTSRDVPVTEGTPVTPTAPSAPSGLTATAVSTSQIDLTWTDNSDNEDGFRIERCDGEGCTNFGLLAGMGTNVTTYSDVDLTAETTYLYRVAAYNETGQSEWSNVADATTRPPAASNTVSVARIAYTTHGGRNNNQHLTVTLTVVDADDGPVAGAEVSFTLRHETGRVWNRTATTGSNGQVSLTVNSAPTGSYTTTVGSVTGSGMEWDEVTPVNSFTK
jgi:PKD repeat protein